MQIIKVSAQGQDEYYIDFKLAFRRWLELDGEEVSFEVLEIITSPRGATTMGWIFLLGFGLGLAIGLAITCLAVLGAASIIHKSGLELVGNRLIEKISKT